MDNEIFDYDLGRIKNNYQQVLSYIRKYRNILYNVPKVYFIVKRNTNTIIYIGSSKLCLFSRIYYHINESIDLIKVYHEYGHVRPQSNNYKKAKLFCDLVYNLEEFDVVVFGEYETLEHAEIAEKSLIFYSSNCNYAIDLCNSSGVKKLSTKTIKK